jgi:hypothetical protein
MPFDPAERLALVEARLARLEAALARAAGHASIETTEGYYVARGSIEPADVALLSFGPIATNAAKAG